MSEFQPRLNSMPSHVAGVLSDLMWNAGVPAGEATWLVLQGRGW